MAEQLQRESFGEFSNLDAIIEYFRAELESGKNRLVELVNEAPESKRRDVALALLTQEFEICKEQGWTFDVVARKQSFPELEREIDGFFANEDTGPMKTDTRRELSAETHYQVDPTIWQQGGQGALHKGRDQGLGQREVVIKFLKNLKQQNQFHKEIYVTANLDHPGIVAVFSKGTEPADDPKDGHGRPFYAMRLIRGDTLDRRVRSYHHSQLNRKGNSYHTPEFKNLIESLISVCDTIEYAHSRGVLHCDIKPSNIKCGPYNATFVLDWGSSASFDHANADEPLTQSRLSLNEWTAGSYTVQFASPEQLNPGRTSLSPASDVYSLGATLYHMLTNGPPHDQQRQQSEEPPDPRNYERSIPKSLAAICRKAMQQNPSKRYASAHDLGQDLKNWLRDEQVSARPDTLTDRLYRFARRHKALTTNLLLAAAMATTLAMLWFGLRTRELNNQIKAEQAMAGRDSAFDLIEEICEPLAHDSTGNVDEFRRLAGVLDQFASDYLREFNSTNDSGDKIQNKLGKAFQFKAYVNYFRFNHAKDLGEDADQRLNSAIEYLTEAEQHFEHHDAAELASTRLLKSRLLFRQLQTSGKDSLESLGEVLVPLDQAIKYYRNGERRIDDAVSHVFASVERDEAIDQLLDYAEGHHLRGELLLTFRAASKLDSLTESQQVRMNLEKAKAEFSDSVAIRDAVVESPQFEGLNQAKRNLVLRDVGRGYGWLGDVEKFLGDLDDAATSYSKSLRARRQLATETGEEEHLFQLARGWANFATLTRDNGDAIDGQQLLGVLQEYHPTERNLENGVERLVVDTFLQNSMDIRTKLARLGDERFRTDLATSWNLRGELLLFAAMNTEDPQRRQELLAEVLDSARNLQSIFADLDEDRLAQSNKILLATSYMLTLQANSLSADGQVAETDIERVKNLLDVEEFGYRNMNFESLFAYCVALKAQGGDSLDKVIRQLIKKETSSFYRINQHFGADYVEKMREQLEESASAEGPAVG